MKKRFAAIMLSIVLATGSVGTTMSVFAQDQETESSSLLEGLFAQDGALGKLFAEDGELAKAFSEDGGLGKLFAEDGELAKAFSEDGELGKLFAEDGPVAGLFAEDGPLAGLFAEDGPLAELFAEDGPLAGLFAEDGPLAKLFAENGPLAELFAEDGPLAGQLDRLFAEDGPLVRLFAEDGPLAGQLDQLFAEDGPLTRLFAKDGPLAEELDRLFAEDGPLAEQLSQLFAEDGLLAGQLEKFRGEDGYLSMFLNEEGAFDREKAVEVLKELGLMDENENLDVTGILQLFNGLYVEDEAALSEEMTEADEAGEEEAPVGDDLLFRYYPGILPAVESYITEMNAQNFDKSDATFIVPMFAAAKENENKDLMILGDFWQFNYNLDGENLVMASGGSFPGIITMNHTAEDTFQAADMVIAQDGEGNWEDIESFCAEMGITTDEYLSDTNEIEREVVLYDRLLEYLGTHEEAKAVEIDGEVLTADQLEEKMDQMIDSLI